MSKYHINKKGVPSICKATKGNCPLGGVDGNENHFDTKEEAQKAADKLNEENYGLLNTRYYIANKPRQMFYELQRQMREYEGKHIAVEYDNKEFDGEVESVYYPNDNEILKGKEPGFIIKSHSSEDGGVMFKHIKIGRIADITDLETGETTHDGILNQVIRKDPFYGVRETQDGEKVIEEYNMFAKDNSITKKMENNLMNKTVTFFSNYKDAKDFLE